MNINIQSGSTLYIVFALLCASLALAANNNLSGDVSIASGSDVNRSGIADTDSDGVGDDVDNCTNAANPLQEDTDGDGHGNICDADFDNNCFTTFPDLSIMQAGFFTNDALLDLNSSGGPVNFADLALMQGAFFTAPGPSALGSLCNPFPPAVWDQGNWDQVGWQ